MPTITFPYELQRSARRTQLCIQIKNEQVKVLAPSCMPLKTIESFLRNKERWVNEKMALQLVRQQQLAAIKSEQRLLIDGVECFIRFSQGSTSCVYLNASQLHVQTSSRVEEQNITHYRQQQISQWFAQRAGDELPKKLQYWSGKLQLIPQSLQIKKYKSRWGSCSGKEVISLNTLLMMTPDYVIDYVIVHELCHLRHMNHSKAFWLLVANHYPRTEEAKQWLKSNRLLLNSILH